ncbi:MAG: hypothetical protein IJ867_04755 [Clostridia bacterium]|nr:hypothetical protein [Clostridia bacterium]
MKIVYSLLYLYLLFRPYYFFSSGGLQISDLFLILAFIVFLIAKKNNKSDFYNEIKENRLFLIFILCTLLINTVYFLIYNQFKFILSTIYYVFIFLAIILFSYSFRNNEKFISNMERIIKLNLVIQLIFFLTGLGRDYDAQRYMGTFNDPNQFAYYILISYSYIYLINIKTRKSKFIWLLISIFMIIQSSSTGMLMGITAFTLLDTTTIIKNIAGFLRKNLKSILFILFIGLFIIAIVFLFEVITTRESAIISRIKNLNILKRLEDKISRTKTEDTGAMSIWEERGYDKIYYYPQYMLFGAGEGFYSRFSKARHNNEIHATFPSILFYYGIIPLVVLLNWIYKNIKNEPFNVKIVYIALFIESFTLLNQRQALFWLIIVLGKYFSKEGRNMISEK